MVTSCSQSLCEKIQSIAGLKCTCRYACVYTCVVINSISVHTSQLFCLLTVFRSASQRCANVGFCFISELAFDRIVSFDHRPFRIHFKMYLVIHFLLGFFQFSNICSSFRHVLKQHYKFILSFLIFCLFKVISVKGSMF